MLVCMLMPCRAEEGPAWDRSLSIGLNLSEGNTDTALGHASLRAVREEKEDYLRFLLEGTYGETNDETTTQKARGQVQYRHHLDGSFLYTDLDGQHDDPAEVDYRVIAGGGLGKYLARDERALVSAEIGLGYLWEKIKGDEDDHVVLRLAQRGNWELSTKAKIWESVEFVPKAETLDDYLIIGEAGVETSITKQIYLRLVAQDRYDSVPAAGVEHNDISLISALTWRL